MCIRDSPKGIISGVIPTTNPNMTVLVNGIYALKGANVCIFAPHPRAKISTAHTCELLEQAIQAKGGPANVFQCVDDPNMELTQMMMAASDTVLGLSLIHSLIFEAQPERWEKMLERIIN